MKNKNKKDVINIIINKHFDIVNYQLIAKSADLENHIQKYYYYSYDFNSSLQDFKSAFVYDIFHLLLNKSLKEISRFQNDIEFIKYCKSIISFRYLEYRNINKEVKQERNSLNNKNVYITLDKTEITKALLDSYDFSYKNFSQEDKNFKNWFEENKKDILTKKQALLLENLKLCLDFDTFTVDFKKYQTLDITVKHNNVVRDFNNIKKKILVKFNEDNAQIYSTKTQERKLKYLNSFLDIFEELDSNFSDMLDFISLDFKNNWDLQDMLQSKHFKDDNNIVSKCICLSKHNTNKLTLKDLNAIKLLVVDYVNELNNQIEKLNAKNYLYTKEQKNKKFKANRAKKRFSEFEKGVIKITL